MTKDKKINEFASYVVGLLIASVIGSIVLAPVVMLIWNLGFSEAASFLDPISYRACLIIVLPTLLLMLALYTDFADELNKELSRRDRDQER